MIKAYEHFITWYDLLKYYIQNQQEFQALMTEKLSNYARLIGTSDTWFNLHTPVLRKQCPEKVVVSRVFLLAVPVVWRNWSVLICSWLFGFSFCWFGWLVGWLDCRFSFLLFLYQFRKKSCFYLSPMLLYWQLYTNLFSLKCSRPTKFLFLKPYLCIADIIVFQTLIF